MTSGKTSPICFWCKHFQGDFKCKAFPGGIPEEILGDEYGPSFDHHYPYPNDEGIQFEKANLEILLQRPFIRQFSSPEIIERIFQRSLKIVQHNHQVWLNPPPPPKKMHIIPLHLTEAQGLRDRFKVWNLDLNDSSNHQYIPLEVYTLVQNDLVTYVAWLEKIFADTTTRREAIEAFSIVVNCLGKKLYPDYDSSYQKEINNNG